MVLTVSTTSSESSANTTESTRMDTVGNANTMHKWEWLKYWWFQNWNLKIIDGINQIGNLVIKMNIYLYGNWNRQNLLNIIGNDCKSLKKIDDN